LTPAPTSAKLESVVIVAQPFEAWGHVGGDVMKDRVRVVLGVILILLGAALIAERMGWLRDWEALVWTFVLGGVGVAALVIAVSGKEYWWAIIPACLFLSLAVFIYISENNVLAIDDGFLAGGFLLFGLALPFWLILLVRGRSFWWSIIPAGILSFVSLSIALEGVDGGRWTGPLIMWGIAFVFWLVYATNRERWWALIPAGTMTTLGALPLVESSWNEIWILALILGGIGLTFLLVYLLSGLRREFAWAIWPAAGCALVAVGIPLLSDYADLFLPAVLIIVGLTVLGLAFFRRRN
jgi:hypothetical protein